MDPAAAARSFTLPSAIEDVPGAGNWRSLYPYFTRFQPGDDRRFWFYNWPRGGVSVPDRIIQVNDIPATLTGKKMEVPVRKLLLGVPLERAANVNAMANPGSLDQFIAYAREQRDYRLG